MIKRLSLDNSLPKYKPVCEEYIVCSKDCGSGVSILGWLRYNDGDYTFEYHDKAPYDVGFCGYLSREVKIHNKSAVDRHIFNSFAPGPDDDFHNQFCTELGVPYPCTNRWRIFEASWERYRRISKTSEPLGDPYGYMVFYRELHRRVLNE